MLFDENKKWKHSKLNKTGFDSLCKVEALNSLSDFFDGSLENHKQIHKIVIDNYDRLKKGVFGMSMRKAAKEDAPEILPQLVAESSETKDWTRVEKLLMYQDLCSATRDDIAFPEVLMKKIKSSGVSSVLKMTPGSKGITWFCVGETIRKTTKNNKEFYRLRIVDNESNTGWLRMWGSKPSGMEPYTIWLGNIHNDKNWGASTSSRNVKRLA